MEQNIQKARSRQTPIELLRILAMLGVVCLHYNNAEIGGGFRFAGEGTANQYFLFFTESLFICAVNLYILISGYFLCHTTKRRLSKLLELLVQVSVIRTAVYLIHGICVQKISPGGLISALLPIDYFIILYCCVYLIGPYINMAVTHLTEKTFRKLLLLLLLLFSAETFAVDVVENISGYSLNGLSAVGLYGSQHGYSIVNFLLMYIIGAYIGIYGISLSRKKTLLITAVTLILLFGFATVEQRTGLPHTTAWYYNNPLVILMAVCVFLIFSKMTFQSKTVNALAQGAFTCYLLHGSLLKYAGVQKAVSSSLLFLAIHHLLTAVFLYLISYLAYKLYHLCTHRLLSYLQPLCDRISVSTDDRP